MTKKGIRPPKCFICEEEDLKAVSDKQHSALVREDGSAE